jgi:hypothetical protein
MKSVRGFWSDNFIREIVREQGRTFIRSKCNDCGASAVANNRRENLTVGAFSYVRREPWTWIVVGCNRLALPPFRD